MTYFDSKAEALAFSPAVAPDYVGFHGEYGDWLGRKAAGAVPHDNKITIAEGSTYARVPAQVATPASVTELGLLPNQGHGVDVRPAWDKVMQATRASGFANWFFPGGEYVWKSQPEFIDVPMTLRGEHRVSTLHKKLWANQGAIYSLAYWDIGIFNIRVSNVLIEQMDFAGFPESQVVTGQNRMGSGCHISVVSPLDAQGNAVTIGYHTFRDLNLTSAPAPAVVGGPDGPGAALAGNVVLRGADAGNGQPTVRTVMFDNCAFFGCELASLNIFAAAWVRVQGGSFAQAGGKTARILINGSAQMKSSNVVIDTNGVMTGVTIGHAKDSRVDAACFERDTNGNGLIHLSADAVRCFTRGPRNNVVVEDLSPTSEHNDL